MDEQDLKKLLLGRRTEPPRRGDRCPDEIQLAAYVDQKLESPALELVEKHLADCELCLNQVAFLTEAVEASDSDEVPAPVLRRARDLVPQKSVTRLSGGWRWAMAGAAAACVLLMVAFIAMRFRTPNPPNELLIAQQSPPDTGTVAQTTPGLSAHGPSHPVAKPNAPEPAAPAIRREGQAQLPAVVFPKNGATLRRSEVDLRWAQLADAVFYDIRVVTAEGDLVLESKTEDTHLRLGEDLRLQPGAKYFVMVRAHLRQGTTVKSPIVSFRISD